MMKCCDKEIMILSGFHHVDNAWGFNVGACQTCGNVFRMDGWPNKDVFALTLSGEVEKIDLKKKAQEEFDKAPGPIVTVPSGLEVEMLPEKYYMRRYQGSVMNRPTPNNIGGWAMFVLKDRSVFDSLTDEDKRFLSEHQYDVYKVWHRDKLSPKELVDKWQETDLLNDISLQEHKEVVAEIIDAAGRYLVKMSFDEYDFIMLPVIRRLMDLNGYQRIVNFRDLCREVKLEWIAIGGKKFSPEERSEEMERKFVDEFANRNKSKFT